MTDTTDQVARTANHIYLILSGQHYRWTGRVGWEVIKPEQAPDAVTFCPILEAQRKAFMKGLKEQKLL